MPYMIFPLLVVAVWTTCITAISILVRKSKSSLYVLEMHNQQLTIPRKQLALAVASSQSSVSSSVCRSPSVTQQRMRDTAKAANTGPSCPA